MSVLATLLSDVLLTIKRYAQNCRSVGVAKYQFSSFSSSFRGTSTLQDTDVFHNTQMPWLRFHVLHVLKASLLLVHRQYLFLDEARPHHHFHPLVVRSVTLEALVHSYFHVMTATVTMDFLPLISPMEMRCFLRSLPIIDVNALYEILLFEMHWPFNKGLMEVKRY
jgi:hypothetical protein